VHHPHSHHFRFLQIALLLIVCAAGAPDWALAQAQTSPFMTGATALQTNLLILRCSGSENGGTSQFVSRLIGDREVIRRQVTRGRDRDSAFSTRGSRRSRSITEQHVTEPAVLPSEIEQLPDFCGYIKCASSSRWLKASFGDQRGAARR